MTTAEPDREGRGADTMSEATGDVERNPFLAVVRAELDDGEGPSPTALAAKAFMERTSGDAYQRAIENAAILGGWVGSRQAGSRDVALSDAIAKAALSAVMDLFRGWAAECGEPATGPTSEGAIEETTR